ncbi:hypothetical protein ACTXT7_000670 [Hymenolepis weldensis]
MAPRTVDVSNSNNANTQTSLQTAIKQESEFFISSCSFKQEMERPNLPCFNPCIYDGLTAESVEFKLQNLAARCEQAEKRALWIRLKINRLRLHRRITVSMVENLSDVTESSSEDEISDLSEHLELSIRNRAAIRCHWFSLKSEKVIAEDCLRNLKKLRKEFGKSKTFFKGEGGDCAIRTCPYETSSRPKHNFYKLSISDLDFQYPGQAPVNDYISTPRRQLLSDGRSFKSRRESHPSGSSGVSSLGSQDDYERILNCSSVSLSRPTRTPLTVDRKRKFDFSSAVPSRNSDYQRASINNYGNNIPHISWKKVPYPSSFDTERDVGLRKPQNMYKYREHSLTNHHQHAFESSNGKLELTGSRKRKFSSTLPPKFPPYSKRPHLP